jgi:Tol biopolymer transport system component
MFIAVLVVGLGVSAAVGSRAVAAAGAPGLDAAASAPQTSGKLVVVGRDPAPMTYELAHDGLYVVNADGTGLRQVTHSISDEEPHWSPDGRWIAYVSSSSVDVVAIVRNDGSRRRVIGRGATFFHTLDTPSPWSPDGSELAWGGCGGLCIVDLASSRLRRIPLGGDDSSGYAWAPDGRALAAVDHDGRLVVVGADGGAAPIVLAAAGSSPSWSPDARQVAFLVKDRLEVVAAAGGVAGTVARNVVGRPRWSPRGRLLLFVTRKSGAAAGRVRVADLAARYKKRIVVRNSNGDASWSPDGSAIVYTRNRWPSAPFESDMWTVRQDGGGAREVTSAFPTGVEYEDVEWAAGSLSVASSVPPNLLSLATAAELKLVDRVDGVTRAGTADSVAYAGETLCDANAETTSGSFSVWTPATQSIVTTSSPCQDFQVDEYAVTPTLAAWSIPPNIGFEGTVGVSRSGVVEGEIGAWSAATEEVDIGYRNDLGNLVGDGSVVTFETWLNDGSLGLWRIADGSPPHAVPIPLPSDAAQSLDADGGRILLLTSAGGLVVLTTDGTVVSRIPPFLPRPVSAISPNASRNAKIGGGVVGTVAGTTLRVYRTDDASPIAKLVLAHGSGSPRLLSIDDEYAAYASGIELHLMRLRDGLNRVLDLPGEAGPIGALLTSAGLFISYDRAYDRQPGRILFVPAANLP